ncbi:MAG: hypothetical protein IPG50_08790 [Myxococcales bacterium]|nr:hypothetical protein [Myxococcales bacterium]
MSLAADKAMRALVLLAALVAVAGCSRRSSGPVAVKGGAAKSAATVDVPAPVGGVHGARKLEGLDVPVYVDGKPVATLRFGELPSSLVPRGTASNREVRFYRLHDYLAAVGVPMARLRAVHVRGNGFRVASLEADELAKDPDRFLFHFQDKETGIARTFWSTQGLKNLFRSDEIRELFVFVDKEAPVVAKERACYLEAGRCSDKVPYAEDKLAKGTRVYVDGKLVGQVKRRRLGDDLIVGKSQDGQPQFALTKLMASYGVDLEKAASVDVLLGDDLIGRATGRELIAREAEARFVLPPHQHGRVKLGVPPSFQSTDAPVSAAETDVTAVLVHVGTQPRQRSLTPISEAISAAVSASEETRLASVASAQ